MKAKSQRREMFWFMLCALVLLIAATADYSISQGASAETTFPLPVNVPVPDSVLFTDNFGKSMAIDGDTLVVGAPWTEVNGAHQQGVVFIYTRSASDPTAFTLLKSITGSDSSARHEFGWVVGIHGDTLVVGTADSPDGAAYIFERNQGGPDNWGEVKKLERDDDRTFTHYGRNVAIHGDTVVVAAPLGLGEVFIYERDEDGENQWGKSQSLDTGLPITSSIRIASFGEQLAFDGNTLVVGAPQLGLTADDIPGGSPVPPQNFVGALFIYRPFNDLWAPEAKLFSSEIVPSGNQPTDDVYGASLALNGDTLFVGATGGATNGVFAGKVFVLQRGAGTPLTLGVPGPWGEVAQLNPEDGVDGDNFGRALYAVDDGLFVGSEKQGVGKVYFFRNPAGIAGNAALPQGALAWSGIYSFTTSTNGSSTQFGLPLTGSGDSIIFGDHSANEERGGIVAYSKAALFAFDPNAEPAPTATPTETATPPIDPGPCVYFTQQTTRQLYLPAINGGSGSPDSAAAATQPLAAQPHEIMQPVVAALASGCAVSGPGGLKIGAVAGAITQTLVLTMEVTAAPSEALPAGAVPAGEYLRVSSAKNKHVDMETPFVIGVPVPANVDSAHLVLVHLLPATQLLDSKASGNVWSYLPGVYDGASGLFLARMPFLLAEGTTFVLAEHPDFDSPPNQPPSTVQTAAVGVRGEFSVYCIIASFNRPTDCNSTLEADTKAALDEIYQRMTDPNIFGFPRKLRLLDSGSQFIVSETISVTALSASYVAYIQGPKDATCAGGAAGYYSPDTGMLVLCSDAGETFDLDAKETMIHEFFHAVEFTHPKVYEDDFWGFLEVWITEGMAEAAVKSYPVNKMQRSPYFGVDNLQKVDQALTTGAQSDASVDEYLAQDFWVYVGASLSKDMGYFGPMLSNGGAHRTGIDAAFEVLHSKPLRDFYWGWVKNQTVENFYDIGVGPGKLCELNEEALVNGAPVEFPASEEFFPFNTQSAYDILPPLTAKVIEIKFGTKTGAMVHVEYQGCAGLQDSTAKASCEAAARQTLRVKIYEEGESQCFNDALPGVSAEGLRQLTSISPVKRYFVVVANVDASNNHGYFIAIE